jgi:hypothetical protein
MERREKPQKNQAHGWMEGGKNTKNQVHGWMDGCMDGLRKGGVDGWYLDGLH